MVARLEWPAVRSISSDDGQPSLRAVAGHEEVRLAPSGPWSNTCPGTVRFREAYRALGDARCIQRGSNSVHRACTHGKSGQSNGFGEKPLAELNTSLRTFASCHFLPSA